MKGKIKKKIRMFLGIMLLLAFGTQTVRADTGPKPSVQIDFEGLEGEPYYVTLLSEVQGTGPHHIVDETAGFEACYKEGDEDYDIFRKFVEYEDTDGYYFIQYFEECTETQQFVWGYYPPEHFKILLYFPERDYFLTDYKVYERYAFDSYYRVRVEKGSLETTQGVGTELGTENDMEMSVEWDSDATMVMTVERENGRNIQNYVRNILALIGRALITLAVELGIAYLFAFREKRQLRLLVMVNLITQLGLNLALYLLFYSWGSMSLILFYVPLEILVFVAEGAVYTGKLNVYAEYPVSKIKIWAYAFAANAASFLLGIWLSDKIPVIF